MKQNFQVTIKKHMKQLVFITLFLFIPLSAVCRETHEIPDQATVKAEVFNRIKEAASGVKTLKGEFAQEKHLEILENSPVSRGKLFYRKPDCLRWEVYEPVSMGFIVNGDKGKRWSGPSESLQTFDLKEAPVVKIISDQVFAWAGADFERLEARYDITIMEETPVIIKLIPLSVTEKKYLDYIRLIFSADENYVDAIEIHEAGGDYTQINFFNMELNEAIAEDIF